MQDGYVLFSSFARPEEAMVVRSLLEAAEIPCLLANEHIVGMDFFLSQAVGGVRLFVPKEELETAKELVATEATQPPSDSKADYSPAPHCPLCRGTDLKYIHSASTLTKALFYFGIPLPFFKKGWQCNRCLAQWKDQGKVA